MGELLCLALDECVLRLAISHRRFVFPLVFLKFDMRPLPHFHFHPSDKNLLSPLNCVLKFNFLSNKITYLSTEMILLEILLFFLVSRSNEPATLPFLFVFFFDEDSLSHRFLNETNRTNRNTCITSTI